MIKTRLVRLLSHAKKYIIYNILWQWTALWAQILAVFSIARLLDRLVNAGNLPQALGELEWKKTLLILVLAAALRFLCERMAARASYGASADVKRILRKKIYEKLLRLGTSYKEKTSTSEVVQLSTEGVEQLEIYFGKYLPQLFYSLLAPLTFWGFIFCKSESQPGAADLCAPDPCLHCGSTEIRQKAAEQILGRLYGPWRQLSGKPSGTDYLEDLSGR